jgi:beta-galactosidase
MDLATKYQLRVTLNTIFDVAPVWLYERFPDAKQVRCDGSVVEPQATPSRQIGGFPGPCYRHPRALAERRRFMRALLEHFRTHPALDMLDVWNEPEQDGLDRAPSMPRTVCYCAHCREAFVDWLRSKYRDLALLNRVWGRNYTDWSAVELPRSPRATFVDFVDWREFHLDGMTREARWRLELARELAPGHVAYLHVVPNTMRTFNAVTGVDDFAIGREGEVFAGTGLAGAAYSTELISAARGRTTYNVECHINRGQTSLHQHIIRLPDLCRELIPQVGIGIRGFLFWQFRPEVLGAESPAWGLVRPDGSPRPATDAAREFWARLRPHADRLLTCSSPVPAVAIWRSRKNEIFSFASDGDLTPLADAVEAYTNALYWSSIPCRYVSSDMIEADELAGVRLLVMPQAYYLTEPEAAAIDRWVRAGGVLLCEAHLGGYNGTTGRHSRRVPGCGLAERWGFHELDSTAAVHLDRSPGRDASTGAMAPEVRQAFERAGVTGGRYFPITLRGGRPLAGCERFAILDGEGLTVEGRYAGDVPVIVSKPIGAGRVIYGGTDLGQGAAKLPDGFRDLVKLALDAAGVAPVLGSHTDEPETVRVDVLGGTAATPAFITMLNRTGRTQVVHLTGAGRFSGLYSGLELDLEADTTLRLPQDFADLFVGPAGGG